MNGFGESNSFTFKNKPNMLNTICNMKEKILFRYIKHTYSIRRGKTRKNEKRKMVKQYEYPAKRKVGWSINT